MIFLEKNISAIPSYLLIAILIMGAFGVMGGGLVAPALPSIGEAFMAREEQLGLILSVYTFSAALSLPFIGYLLDTLGPRRMALFCLILDGATGIVITLAPTFPILLVLRFIQGIGISGLVPIAMTIIGRLFSGEKRLKVMGYLTGVISLGVVIIPSLGGFLAAKDWRFVFLVYGFSLFLALFFFFALPSISSGAEKTTKQASPLTYLVNLFSVLKIQAIRHTMYHSLAIYFYLYTLVTFLPLYLIMGHGFDTVFTGLALSLHGLFSAFVSSLAHFLARYLKWQQRTTLGYAFMALCFLLLPLWPQGSYLVSFSFIFYGIGMGMVVPTVYNRVTRLPPKEIAGSVIAIFNTMKYLGMTLSPLILGFLLSFVKLETIFIGVGVSSLLWGIKTSKF